MKAADKGELDWMDVAFFVDKVMVAKKEKQVYGTQSKITKNHEKIRYLKTTVFYDVRSSLAFAKLYQHDSYSNCSIGG